MDEQSKTYEATDLPTRLMDTLNTFYNDELFCDFVIKVADSEFKVHKVILVCCSDYFKAMFQHAGTVIESQNNRVDLSEVTPSAMGEILNFCYTAKISLNMDNVQDILIAASYLGINHIVKFCSEFLIGKVSTNNCIGILVNAARCGDLHELYQHTLNYCLANFETISEEREFLEIDEVNLNQIISHDKLDVQSEASLFNAIIRWISADPERAPSLGSLMQHVRFPFINPRTLVELSKHPLVVGSEECRSIIDEAKNYFLLERDIESVSSYISSRSSRFKSRDPGRLRQRIYALGGWTNLKRPTTRVEVYNPFEDEWDDVTPMPRPLCGVGVAIHDGFLYAIGGHDGINYLRSAARYDIKKDQWLNDIPQMVHERTSVGVVSLKGYIYILGGQHQTTIFDAVERYDPKLNQWSKCPPLLQKRLGPGVAVLDGKIYVTGGADTKPMDSVECFDPETGVWSFVSSMKCGRKHHGCTSYKNKIYVVGGRGDSTELSTAECYDPIKDEWQSIADMRSGKSGIGLVEVDGTLYCMGGHCREHRLRDVEAYDPVNDSWSDKKPMKVERLGGGFAVSNKCTSI